MPVSGKNRFLLLYGSQTGQAQAIAEEIADKAEAENLHAEIHCLSLTEKKFFLERESCVVIVTSTTGDGEPPDTVIKFLRRLKKKTLSADHLSQLNYALLGLGDSNYTNFCNCGKTLDRRLQELGARHFYDSGWADDAVGLEVKVEPWIDSLWPALKKCLCLPSTDVPNPHLQNTAEPHSKTCGCNGNNTGDIQCQESSVSGNLCVNVDNTDKQVSDTQTSVMSNRHVTSTENRNQSNSNTNPNSMSSTSSVTSSSIMDTTLASVAHSDKSLDPCDSEDVKNPENCGSSSLTTDTTQKAALELKATVTTESELTNMCVEAADSSTSNVNSVNQTNTHMASPGDKAAAVAMTASVRQSVPPLSESSLTIPALPAAFLKLEFNKDLQMNVCDLPLQNGHAFPSAASPVSMATVKSAVTLTSDSAVKKTMALKLAISGCGIVYEPGDSFSIVCPNPGAEVQTLLTRLSVHENIDTPCTLSILVDTKKRRAMVPPFIPACMTLRHIFTTCLDIREPPKKAFLRALVDHTTDQSERRRLQELCSKQGSDDYARFIREPSLSFQDILDNFPSCVPPVERVIEHLPRLQPRPYSICCSQLASPSCIDFVFNVINIPAVSGRTYARKGLCTGWLEQIAGTLNGKQSSNSVKGVDMKREPVPSSGVNEWERVPAAGDVNEAGDHAEDCLDDRIIDDFKILNISSEIEIPIFARTNQRFHLTNDIRRPIIMVGPGTGVAPFIGFLQHRAALIETAGDTTAGESWLFYGCRHEHRDYLYRSEIEEHASIGTLTRLCVCFSRDDQPQSSPRYVQDSIRSHGADLLRLLEEGNAIVYVCGDARNMAKDVLQAFVDVYTSLQGYLTPDQDVAISVLEEVSRCNSNADVAMFPHTGITSDQASKKLTELRLEKRYLEDVWT